MTTLSVILIKEIKNEPKGMLIAKLDRYSTEDNYYTIPLVELGWLPRH